eukprot:TRINITY_DN49166_c0_g1_i1.p1 TRINITY_DN49166_c0_g1~~TRINITY_DN49166_c0_g1_i1.p1  ORF type:complete len:300 (-),score=12.80 TRINITY_DN49166_c0_g1_i1:283-1110(-)
MHLSFLKTMLQVSRPGLYHLTAFIYAFPAHDNPWVLVSPSALQGLLFAVFPLNLLVYSFNDLRDVDVDRKNERKGGMHGAQASTFDLQVCVAISIASVIILVPLLTGDMVWSSKWVAGCIFVNWVYNFGPQLSRVPFLDMFPPVGYLGTCSLAAKVMAVPDLDRWVYGYLALICFRTQLWLQRMDAVADARVGKRTTAVCIGPGAAAVGVVCFLGAEVVMSISRQCLPAGALALYSLVVFLWEVANCNKERTMFLMMLGGLPYTYFMVTSNECLA